MAVFRIPGITDRTTITGKTGSGKTQGGAFLLSQMPFDQMPFVMFDYKREKLFAEFGARELFLGNDDLNYRTLNQAGLFIVRPRVDQETEVDQMLYMIWEHENCGIFIDEGYMMAKSKALITVLTQGRSKNIPMITLTQRPRFITPFVFSEAEYLMIFRLSKPEDRKTVQDYVDEDISERLPPYHSYWYDVSQDKLTILRPVPDRDWIIKAVRGKIANLEQRQRSKQFI